MVQSWILITNQCSVDLREIEWEGVDWMYMTQNMNQWWALVNEIMNLWVP